VSVLTTCSPAETPTTSLHQPDNVLGDFLHIHELEPAESATILKKKDSRF
jgi:hypothetical protein